MSQGGDADATVASLARLAPNPSKGFKMVDIDTVNRAGFWRWANGDEGKGVPVQFRDVLTVVGEGKDEADDPPALQRGALIPAELQALRDDGFEMKTGFQGGGTGIIERFFLVSIGGCLRRAAGDVGQPDVGGVVSKLLRCEGGKNGVGDVAHGNRLLANFCPGGGSYFGVIAESERNRRNADTRRFGDVAQTNAAGWGNIRREVPELTIYSVHLMPSAASSFFQK